jgi:hypothetical protein
MPACACRQQVLLTLGTYPPAACTAPALRPAACRAGANALNSAQEQASQNAVVGSEVMGLPTAGGTQQSFRSSAHVLGSSQTVAPCAPSRPRTHTACRVDLAQVKRSGGRIQRALRGSCRRLGLCGDRGQQCKPEKRRERDGASHAGTSVWCCEGCCTVVFAGGRERPGQPTLCTPCANPPHSCLILTQQILHKCSMNAANHGSYNASSQSAPMPTMMAI